MEGPIKGLELSYQVSFILLDLCKISKILGSISKFGLGDISCRGIKIN